MRKFLIWIGICASFWSCNHSFALYDVEDSAVKLTQAYTEQDQKIEAAIQPYRAELAATMNEVVVVSSGNLVKAKPSSPLGNLLADATKAMASDLLAEDIDIGIMNYGGIRVPSISAGNVTIGNVYELMPFDNYLVVLRLKGSELQHLFDAIAAGGGWPIAGAKFTISEGRATQIMLKGSSLDLDREYSVAISDYLANGGDHLDMLKGIAQESTNILLRDAFMAYFRKLHEQGKQLPLDNEIRISNE